MTTTQAAADAVADTPTDAATEDYTESGHFELDIAGERFCVPRFCPHRGGRLVHGIVNARRKTLICPLHHSVFSLETGAQLAGPPCGPLAVLRRGSQGEPCK